MSARAGIAAYLTDALRSFRVVPSSDGGTITKPTALVYTTELAAGAVQGYRDATLSVVVVGPKQVGAEDDLEGYLYAALAALDACDGATWTKAVRSVYADQYPAYDITVEATEIP